MYNLVGSSEPPLLDHEVIRQEDIDVVARELLGVLVTRKVTLQFADLALDRVKEIAESMAVIKSNDE